MRKQKIPKGAKRPVRREAPAGGRSGRPSAAAVSPAGATIPSGKVSLFSPKATVKRVRKKFKVFSVRGGVDRVFLYILLSLLVFGLVMLFSASFATSYFNSEDGNSYSYIVPQMCFAALGCVLLAEAAPCPGVMGPGVPDELFCRGKVPMTKREVRAAAMSRLRVQPGETCWDVGAGTGSVSIELALAARGGAVWAVEQNAAACDLIRLNRRRFGAWNLHLREGLAPAALADLPAPDAVFVGGTKGNMDAILAAALEKNPAARICVSAIAPETLAAALAAFAARGQAAQAVQIAVSRSRAVAGLHLMEAANPITLVAANCP